MIENIFWNLVFLADVGGCIALGLYALARWPVLIQRADTILTLAGCSILLVLLAGFVAAHVFEVRRGAWIHGVHYEDVWRDD